MFAHNTQRHAINCEERKKAACEFGKMRLVFVTLCSLITVIAQLPPSPIANLESPPFNQLLTGRQLLISRPGDNVTLPCRMYGNPAPSIEWYRSWSGDVSRSVTTFAAYKLSLMASNMNMVAFSNQSQARSIIWRYVTEPGSGTLLITRVDETDVGLFQCVARNRHGATVSDVFELRLAESAQFQQGSATVLEAAVGDSVVLRCNFPRAFPTPARYWSVFDESNPSLTRPISVDTQNQGSARITTDYDGNLYFTNIQLEDYNSGEQRYVANQYQKDVRSSYHGCDHVLKQLQPQGANAPKRSYVFGLSSVHSGQSAKLLYASPDAVTAEENSTVRMKCIFGGRPMPIVEWYKVADGEPTLVVQAQEMVIVGVRLMHAGVYYCAPKQASALRKTFQLDVVYAPRFVVSLQNKVVNEFDSADLRCEAIGKPQSVAIDWFVNGERVTQSTNNRYYRLVNAWQLYFPNVSRAAMSTIQCNASNAVGYAFGEAALVANDKPPVIAEQLSDSAYATGSNMTLRCHSPIPTTSIAWYKDNHVIDERFERVRLVGTSLTLANVVKSDSGSYKCVLTNKFGRSESAARVIVKQRTVVTVTPTAQWKRENETALFSCSFLTDPTERDARVQWKKGHSLIPDEPRFTVTHNGSRSTLQLSDLLLADSDTYYCVVNTSVDVRVAPLKLTVQARPDAPVNVASRCLPTNKEAQLSWQSGAHNNAEISRFLIEYSYAHNSSWQLIHSVPFQSEGLQSATVQLAAWMNYTFRVLAENAVGVSPPSDDAPETCYTPPERPSKNPTNVVVHGVNRASVTVSWTPLERTELSGPEFYYRVRLFCDPDDDFGQALAFANVNVSGHERSQVTITQLTTRSGVTIAVPTYQRCRAQVISSNAFGDCQFTPHWTEGYSAEEPPLVAPAGVLLDTSRIVEANSIAVLVRPPKNTSVEAIRGCWMGYQIGWRHSRVPSTKMQKLVNVSFESCREALDKEARNEVAMALLPSVPGLTNITVVAALTTRYHVGPWSAETVITTPEGVPSKCEELKVDMLGATFVRLKWIKPTNANGIILGYRLAYTTIGAPNTWENLQPASIINDPEMWGGSLYGLQPNTTYKIHLSAFTSKGPGEITSEQITTLDLPQAKMPKATFKVNILNETAVNVTVELSGKAEFYVQYRQSGRTLWQSTAVEPVRKWKLVSGLNKQAIYEFRVVTISSHTHNDATSEIITVAWTSGKSTLNMVSVAWLAAMIMLIIVLVIILTFICCRKKKASISNQKSSKSAREEALPTNGHLVGTYQEAQLTQLLTDTDCQGIPAPYLRANAFDNNANIHDTTIFCNGGNYLTVNDCGQIRDTYTASNYDTNDAAIYNTLRLPNHQVTLKRPVDNFRAATISFSKVNSIECVV